MRNVTDRTSNPFGMRPPCEEPCSPDGPAAVFGYGDANADFHVVGDHPGVHGGRETGVPFTDSESGERLLSVLGEVGLLADPDADADGEGGELVVSNCFLSYLHACCLPGDRAPTAAEYADLERFFDAELRAITADVLLPVGERAIAHVLRTYTGKAYKYGSDLERLHAREIPGMGFLVVPIREPSAWADGDREALVAKLRAVLASDYHQLSDLGRFQPGGDQYLVR